MAEVQPVCLWFCSSSCQSMLGLTLVGEGFLSKPWSQRRPDQWCLVALCVCGCCVELPGYRGAQLWFCCTRPAEVHHGSTWEGKTTSDAQKVSDTAHSPVPDRRCRTSAGTTADRHTEQVRRHKDPDRLTGGPVPPPPPSLCVEDQTWGMLWKIYLPFSCHPSIDCIHLVHSSSECPPPFFVPAMYADVSGLGAKPARRGCVVPACTDCFVLGEGWWQLHVCGLKTRTSRLYTVERCAVGQLGWKLTSEKH